MSRFRYLLVGAALLHLLTLFFDVGIHSNVDIAIAPLALGLIGAAGGQVLGSVANSIIGNQQAKSNAQYSMNMQKDLMDYEWNRFGSPKAQIDSLVQAGLNPSVAFGQGGMRGVSPSGNAPQVATAPVAFDTGLQNLPNAVLAASQAKKAGMEAEGQKLLNDYNMQTMAERVRAVGLANHWTEENTTKVIQDWNKTIGEINILQKDAAIKQIDLDKHSKLVDSLIDSYAAKANLDNEQTHQLREQLPLMLDKLKNEVDILSVDADIANSFKETTATLGVVGQGIKILQTLLKILK